MSVPAEQVELQHLGSVFIGIENQFLGIDYQETLQEFIPELQKAELGQFGGESNAVGDAWKALAPSTIKKKGHDQILFETGRLESSLVGKTGDSIQETTHRGLIFGTSVPYSIFHDVGTERLPIREHVGMDEQTLDKLVNALADATVEGLKATV